jgi:putative spermidine/putrescine transport system substrate-binding protein
LEIALGRKYKDQIALVAPPDIVGISLTLMANKAWGGGDYRKSVETGIAKLAEMAPNAELEPGARSVPSSSGSGGARRGWNARGQLYSGMSQGKLGVAIPSESCSRSITCAW